MFYFVIGSIGGGGGSTNNNNDKRETILHVH